MQTQSYNEEILSLHFGPKSNAIGVSLYALEADQFFQEEDPISHTIYFKDLKDKIPRALFFDNSSAFEILEQINSTHMPTSKESVNHLWNPAKCQVYKQKTEENQKTTFEENLKSVLFKKVMFKKTNLIPLPNFYTSYFTEFFQGNEAIKDIQHSEIVKETIRKSLEEMDRLGGFQIFSDCDSGFGIYSSSVIESIKEECPKAPLFMVPIFERTQETEHLEKIQIMNELFTYSTFREIDLLLPLDFQTAYSNLSNIFEIKKNSEIFEKASNISTLISNGTLPFRIKEETEPLNEYIKRIVYFKNMNIFNLVGTIPIISDKGEILENNIFDFKENKGNFSCLNSFSNPNICKISKEHTNYSEGYMFRGLFDEKSIKTPISYKYNIKGIDALLSFSDKRMMPDIKKEIVENYGKNELEAIPLHTVLFTNDLFKDYLKDLLKKFSTIEFKIKKKFIEEEDETTDTFKEMANSINTICDNYEKN